MTGLGKLFAAGAYVKVILDVTNGYAYIQNADTNAYLEGRLADLDNKKDFGVGNTIGAKGYYFTQIDFETKEITLSTSQKETTPESFIVPWLVGDELSLKNKSWYGYFGKITAIRDNIITVDTLPFDKIENLAGADGDDHCIFALYSSADTTGRTVYHVRPGGVEFAYFAQAFGYNSEVGTKGGINVGGNNKIAPAGGPSATIGSENQVTASNAVAINYQNHIHADNSLSGGSRNTIERTSGDSLVHGNRLSLWAKFCAMFGQNNTLHKDAHQSLIAGRNLVGRGAAQLTVGEWNADDTDTKYDQNSYFVVGGGKKDARKSIFRIRRNGDTDLCSNKVTNMAAGTASTDAVNLQQMNTAISQHASQVNPHGLSWSTLPDKPSAFLNKKVLSLRQTADMSGIWEAYDMEVMSAAFMIVTVTDADNGNMRYTFTVDMADLPQSAETVRKYPVTTGCTLSITRLWGATMHFTVTNPTGADRFYFQVSIYK